MLVVTLRVPSVSISPFPSPPALHYQTIDKRLEVDEYGRPNVLA